MTAVFFLLCAALTDRCWEISYTPTAAWHFVAETIDMTVGSDVFYVDATYGFEGGPTPLPITFPFPDDPSLGEPELIDVSIHGESLPPGTKLDIAMGDGEWTWTMPPARGPVRVRIIYRQPINGARATYVLRSAVGWREPLRSAELILRVRKGALVNVQPELTFQRRDGTYRTRFENWVPESDFVVSVRSATADERSVASTRPLRP